MREAVRLGGAWSEPDKETQDLPGASTQGTKTSRTMGPGFYDSKRPKIRKGWESQHGGQGRGAFTFGGLDVNPNEQKGLLEPWSLHCRTPLEEWLQA